MLHNEGLRARVGRGEQDVFCRHERGTTLGQARLQQCQLLAGVSVRLVQHQEQRSSAAGELTQGFELARGQIAVTDHQQDVGTAGNIGCHLLALRTTQLIDAGGVDQFHATVLQRVPGHPLGIARLPVQRAGGKNGLVHQCVQQRRFAGTHSPEGRDVDFAPSQLFGNFLDGAKFAAQLGAHRCGHTGVRQEFPQVAVGFQQVVVRQGSCLGVARPPAVHNGPHPIPDSHATVPRRPERLGKGAIHPCWPGSRPPRAPGCRR